MAMYSAAEIRRMVKSNSQRSKLSWSQLPEKYRLIRARRAVLGRRGPNAPAAYRDRVVQEMLQSPGQRYLLPDKYLTPDLLKIRQNNRYLKNPVFPGAGLTGNELETQIRRGLEMQYGDQERADTTALAQAEATRTRNQAWWNQYQQAVQNSQAAFNQYAQQQQAPQISTSVPAVNGQAASPTAPAASGVQAALGSIAAGRANANQTATAAAVASGVNVAGQRVGEQRALLDQAVQNALGQQKQTARRKQYSAEELRSKLVNEASQRFLENLALSSKNDQFNKRLELDLARLRSQERQNAADNATSERNNRRTTATSEANSRRSAARRRNSNGTGGRPRSRWATPQQQGTAQSEIGRALAALKKFGNNRRNLLITGGEYGLTDKDGNPIKDKSGKQIMKKAPQIDAIWVDVARDIRIRGGISKKNVQRLHARGINVGKLGYPIL